MSNADLLQRSLAAVWHPCTQMKRHETLPITPVARGDGIWLESPKDGNPVVPSHVAFRAKTADAIKAFHEAGLAAGGTDNGKPGPRPNYGPGYYAAFVHDPDGNNIEAMLNDYQA
mgnify:CR=1 FL=1